MTVRAACSSCGAQFAAQPHLYGKRVPCPNCGGVVAVPDLAAAGESPVLLESVPAAEPAPVADAGAAAADPFGDLLGTPAGPSANPLDGLPSQPTAAAAARVRAVYYNPDTSLSDDDKRVIWYAVGGVAGILVLVVSAIALTQWLSNRGATPPGDSGATAAPTPAGQPADAAPPSPAAETPLAATPPSLPASSPPASGTPIGSGTASPAPSGTVAGSGTTSPPPAAPKSTTEDEAAVRACMEAFQQALGQHNGQAAASLMASSYIELLDRMRQKALTAPETEVRALSVTDRMHVLQLRHILDAKALQSKTAPELFAELVQKGLVAGQGTVGAITIEGNAAKGQSLRDGRPTGVPLAFVKEQGGWKMDLLPALQQMSQALTAVAGLGAQNVDDIILGVLAKATGRVPSADIWQPLVRN